MILNDLKCTIFLEDFLEVHPKKGLTISPSISIPAKNKIRVITSGKVLVFSSFAQVQRLMFTMSNNMQHDATWCNLMLLVFNLKHHWRGVFFHPLEHQEWCCALTDPQLFSYLRPGRWVQGNAQSRRWSHSHWTVHHWDSWRLKKTMVHCSTMFNQRSFLQTVQRYIFDPLESLNPKPWGIQMCQEQFANPLHLTWNTPRNHGLIGDLPSGNLT